MINTDLHPEVRPFIEHAGLLALSDICFPTINHNLASAFVERWHGETNTFHLPVGEMTITLDDVAQLLHIPIAGDFYDFVEPGSKYEAAQWLVDFLGVSHEEADANIPVKGTSITFRWLEEVYKRATDEARWEDAARCYLFLMVGRTLFADKTGNRVKVGFLYMVSDLDSLNTYAWGAMALAHLYKQLTEATSPSCQQIGGYGTLLQAWIFEHFQQELFGHTWTVEGYTEEKPRAKRWDCKRQDGTVVGFRASLDRLESQQVTWMPYAQPTFHRAIERLALFKGFLRWGATMVAYNPDRVVRQFGWVQGIPPDPRPSGRAVVTRDANDLAWINFTHHLIPEGVPVVPGLPATEPGYFTWFRRVSHPYMKPESYPFSAVEFKEALPETLQLYDELETELGNARIPRGTRMWGIVDRLRTIAQPFTRGLQRRIDGSSSSQQREAQ